MKKRKDNRETDNNTLFNPDTIKNILVSAINKDLDCMETHANAEFPNGESYLHYYVGVQRQDLLKRWFVDSDEQTKKQLNFEAASKFRDDNERMASFSRLNLFASIPDFRLRKTPLEKVLLAARNLVHLILTDYDTEELFQNCKHSTGSSVGVPFTNTHTSAKWALPISCTENAKSLFNQYLLWNPLALELMLANNAVKHDGSPREILDIVPGSEFFSVEKDSLSRRGAAKEPTANMFLQQGVMSMLFDRLVPFLDLVNLQEEHKLLARLASIYKTVGTVDFSSASNLIMMDLIEFLVPEKWFDLLCLTRSENVVIRELETVDELFMISSMGNAFTFPLESLVFYALACAVVNYETGGSTLVEEEVLTQVSVFGDDCIIPSDHIPGFIQVCESLGMKVNVKKTYFQAGDPFRESCGGDYYHGHDVRPYFLRAPRDCRLSTFEPWIYSIVNGYLKRNFLVTGYASQCYTAEFQKVVSQLLDTDKFLVKIVPFDYPDDSGVKADIFQLFSLARHRFVQSRIRVDRHGTSRFDYIVFRPVNACIIIKNGKHHWNRSIGRLMDNSDYVTNRTQAWRLVDNYIVDQEPIDRKIIDRQLGGYIKTSGIGFI